MVAGAVLASLILVGLVPGGQSGGEDVEIGRYIGGGSVMGTTSVCVNQLPSVAPDELNHDLFAACNIRCPGGTCDIEVVDDVNDHISFRVCFDGEEFCRPNVYTGWASVAGTEVTVVPNALSATHGIVYVR